MHFDLDEDQREIRSTARELLGGRATPTAVRQAAEAGAYDDGLWGELRELGWAGIALPEEHGGGGLGTVELAVLLEESGATLAPTPLLGAALGALVLRDAGTDEQRAAWLPQLASGEAVAALVVLDDRASAVGGAAGGWGGSSVASAGGAAAVATGGADRTGGSAAAATRGGDGPDGATTGGAVTAGPDGTGAWSRPPDGARRGALVADAAAADVLVVVDAVGSGRLVDPTEATIVELPAVDPLRRYARVDVPDDVGEPLGSAAVDGVDRARIAVAAELVGVCRRAVEQTVAYVKDREQFGVPVGSFQAVSHACAEMLVGAEGARSAVYHAAWAADAPGEGAMSLGEAAALAKAVASDAARSVTAAAIQAHGGVGFTWEADVHWLFKRAQLGAQLLGGPGAQRERLASYLAERAAA